MINTPYLPEEVACNHLYDLCDNFTHLHKFYDYYDIDLIKNNNSEEDVDYFNDKPFNYL